MAGGREGKTLWYTIDTPLDVPAETSHILVGSDMLAGHPGSGKG